MFIIIITLCFTSGEKIKTSKSNECDSKFFGVHFLGSGFRVQVESLGPGFRSSPKDYVVCLSTTTKEIFDIEVTSCTKIM